MHSERGCVCLVMWRYIFCQRVCVLCDFVTHSMSHRTHNTLSQSITLPEYMTSLQQNMYTPSDRRCIYTPTPKTHPLTEHYTYLLEVTECIQSFPDIPFLTERTHIPFHRENYNTYLFSENTYPYHRERTHPLSEHMHHLRTQPPKQN